MYVCYICAIGLATACDSKSDLTIYDLPNQYIRNPYGAICTPSYVFFQKCYFKKIALDLFVSLITHAAFKPTVSQSTEMGEFSSCTQAD